MHAAKDVTTFIGHFHSELTYLLFSRAGTSQTSCVHNETDRGRRSEHIGSRVSQMHCKGVNSSGGGNV